MTSLANNNCSSRTLVRQQFTIDLKRPGTGSQFVGDAVTISIKEISPNASPGTVVRVYERGYQSIIKADRIYSERVTRLLGRFDAGPSAQLGTIIKQEIQAIPKFGWRPMELYVEVAGPGAVKLEICRINSDSKSPILPTGTPKYQPTPQPSKEQIKPIVTPEAQIKPSRTPIRPTPTPNSNQNKSCYTSIFGNINLSGYIPLTRSGTNSIFVGDSIEIIPVEYNKNRGGRVQIYDKGFNFETLIATYNLNGTWRFTRKVEHFKGYACLIKYLPILKTDYIKLEICKITNNTSGPVVTPVSPVNRSCSTRWVVPNGIIAQRLTRPGTNSTFSADTIEIKSIAKQDGAEGSVQIYDTGYNFETLLATYPMSAGWTFTRSVRDFNGYQVTVKVSGKGLIQLQSCHISRGV